MGAAASMTPAESQFRRVKGFGQLPVEQRGEHYTIVRRGKAVAHLEPVDRGRGDQVKAALAHHAPDPAWGDDLDDGIGDDDDVAIAAVTVAELLVGVELATAERRAVRQAFVDDVLDVLPVLPYDLGVAQAHAALLAATRRAGRPRGAHDLIIAATARASSRRIVTANPSGFEGLPDLRVTAHR
ncbi:MAG: hypothetical protein R6U94_12110 [Nitriliruptoraceae bacterium]